MESHILPFFSYFHILVLFVLSFRHGEKANEFAYVLRIKSPKANVDYSNQTFIKWYCAFKPYSSIFSREFDVQNSVNDLKLILK